MTLDRRRFLMLSGASISAALLDGCNAEGPRWTGGVLNWFEGLNERVERALFTDRRRDSVRRGAKSAGEAFPSYFISDTVPVWDRAARGEWALEVSGLVRRPLRLTLDDLVRLRSITHRVNHYCVEGWDAVAQWTGVRVSELARLAGVAPGAEYVDFQSFDSDYHESWDMESAMHPQTLVAYGMDGAMLGPAHGAPARLHSPVKLGYKSTKYLTRVVFMPRRNGGYWSDQGYEWYAGV